MLPGAVANKYFPIYYNVMMTEYQKNIIESECGFFCVITRNYKHGSEKGEPLRLAAAIGKDVYIIKHRNADLPDSITERPNVRMVAEYEGSMDSDSFKLAETRVLERKDFDDEMKHYIRASKKYGIRFHQGGRESNILN